MRTDIRNAVRLTLAAAALAAAAGCRSPAPRMGRFDVHLTMADSMADSSGLFPSVELHLLALNSVKGRALQAQSMSDYWNPNRRADDFVKHKMYFGEGQPRSQTLLRTDPIWDRWERAGAWYLFVMADLPGIYKDQDDVQDARRLIVPLDPKRWRHRTIDIMIENSSLYCLTPRVPKAAKEEKKGGLLDKFGK